LNATRFNRLATINDPDLPKLIKELDATEDTKDAQGSAFD
jgi:hypothetical protein